MSEDATITDSEVGLVAKPRYCVQVFARSDDDAQHGQVVSEPTQVNGPGEPAFTLTSPQPEGPEAPFVTPPEAYLQPTSGTVTPRTPYSRGIRFQEPRATTWCSRETPASRKSPTSALQMSRRMLRVFANEAPLSDETTPTTGP